ncbi:MAG TPA: efflux RND transporter periplasmic adaptor subunit [Candidatus Angelobacter sp.]|nr:efflux RND transporter periplasmic adaptor subunit [Candidatus Angelobacter sp.]
MNLRLMGKPKGVTGGVAAIFAVMLAFCLCFTGCGKGEKKEAPEVTVKAAPAATEDISRVVNTDAIIFPIAQSAITPKINAPVKKFYVVRGQKVRQGQLLATLENRDLSAAALDNKGAYEQAEAAYSTSLGATLPEENAKAELDVQTAQQELDAQQKLYDSRQDLFKQGALPRKDLDAAAVSLAQAKSAYNIARKHLDGLNAVGKSGAIKTATGQLTSAKGKLANSEAQLSYSELRSPISGFITDRPLYPGEMASTSAPLLTVMDISQVIAKAHIPQSDALQLHKGDAATIALAGLEKPIQGKVSLISPALDPNSTTVEVWVQAPNPDQLLRPGTTAQIAITAQTVKDALVVPSAALLNAKGDAAQVMVVDSQNQASGRDVKTGIQTGQQVQIVSGLKPGEVVVSEGAYGLPDKTKVKIEKPEAEAAAGEGAKDKDKDDDDKPDAADASKSGASKGGSGDKAKAQKGNGKKDSGEKD